uniref:Uncharacterized protein n=1 Tax=Knipowitschia caucasica TaxID=637954 RepID=A0AAV2K1W1_KNICA
MNPKEAEAVKALQNETPSTVRENRLPRFLSLAHHIAKLELGEAGDPIQHRKRPTLKTQVRKNSAFGQLNILSAHSQEEHPGN